MSTSRTLARVPDLEAHDRGIAGAERSAVVIWRGEPIPFEELRARIAEIDGRAERDALFRAYGDALDALGDRYEARLAAWREGGDPVAASSAAGLDPRELAKDLEGFVLHSETPYFAALRRYLALLDIEQGDATVADVWHVARGSSWEHWFGPRETNRALAAVGRTTAEGSGDGGWADAARRLAGPEAAASTAAASVSAAYASIVGSPEWLATDVGIAAAEIPAIADFLAFVRLWRLRSAIGRLQYELRLFNAQASPSMLRAYYAGIMTHMTGVSVPEEEYLAAVPAPFASAEEIRVELLGAQLVEVLEGRFGGRWWTETDATELASEMSRLPSAEDALAYLGYDALDWRPVLRQIRTRLIGEMSGYGGPNITTRAGTRKV